MKVIQVLRAMVARSGKVDVAPRKWSRAQLCARDGEKVVLVVQK